MERQGDRRTPRYAAGHRWRGLGDPAHRRFIATGRLPAIADFVDTSTPLLRPRFAQDKALATNESGTDLLDIEPAIRERIHAMPMLAWKCQNVRALQKIGRASCRERGRGAA